MDSEKLLITQLAEGNKKVFKQIFNEYYYPLCGYAQKLITNTDVCKDLVQEALLQVWHKRAEIKDFKAIKNYLYISVRNGCLNYIRHNKIAQKNHTEIYEHSDESEFTDAIIMEEVHAEIYLAIKSLTLREREIIIKFMNGLSNKEIAEELNISVNTVKTIKKRAYEQLRQKLKGMQWAIFLLIISEGF